MSTYAGHADVSDVATDVRRANAIQRLRRIARALRLKSRLARKLAFKKLRRSQTVKRYIDSIRYMPGNLRGRTIFLWTTGSFSSVLGNVLQFGIDQTSVNPG